MTPLTGIAAMFIGMGLIFRLAPTAAADRLGFAETPQTLFAIRTFAAAGLLGMAAFLFFIQFVPE